MRNPLSFPLSPGVLWLILYGVLSATLLLNPALHEPRSYALALGGGLLLMVLSPPGGEALRGLGTFWWLGLLYAFGTSFWSLSPGVTLRSAAFLGLSTLLYSMVRTLEAPQRARLAAVGHLLAVGVALHALDQWLFGFEKLKADLGQVSPQDLAIATAAAFNRRATGPLLNPGALAALMVFFLPYGAVQTLIRSGAKRVFYGVSTLILLAALFASQSVGAILCLALAALLIMVLRRSVGWSLAVLVGGMMALILVFSLRREDWLLSAFSGRLGLWKTAWELFLAHPFLGTGLGSFESAYRASGSHLPGGSNFAHDLPLQLLVETGLVGTALFLTALVGMVRRFKIPSRWEGWGVMTGTLAVFLFSFLDLPFQMPELVWAFAAIAGALELKPSQGPLVPALPGLWVEGLLLATLAIAGFLPPYSPWAFLLLGGVLWGLAAHQNQAVRDVPLGIALGFLYVGSRVLDPSSSLGSWRFLALAGSALAFWILLSSVPRRGRVLRLFWALGILWSVKVWWASVRHSESLREWAWFQYSDLKGFLLFHNPKHLSLFLLPLLYLLFESRRSRAAMLGGGLGLLTLLRLRSLTAVVALGVAFLAGLRSRKWILAALFLAVLASGAAFLRGLDGSATRWGRWEIWSSAVKVWEMRPWSGVGPGGFAGLYHQVKSPRESGPSRYLMDAQVVHNEPLEWLVSFGVLGSLLAVWMAVHLWRRSRDPLDRRGLAGIGAASCLDFVLHEPMILLQSAGFLPVGAAGGRKPSALLGLLALGLALGLFAPPIFARALKEKGWAEAGQGNFSQGLQDMRTAAKLNPWDARYALAEADYLEALFQATGDKVWAARADGAWDRAEELEPADGGVVKRKAIRWSQRVPRLGPEGAARAREAWVQAEGRLPFDADLRYQEAIFLKGLSARDPRVLVLLGKAVELEPQFARAWLRLGLERLGGGQAGREDLLRALSIHERWKDVPRIDLLERELTGLSPQELALARKAVGR